MGIIDRNLVPEELRAKIEQHNPKFVYLIPTFQNPSGRAMTLARRQAVAEVLESTGIALLEDKPYGELRYEGEPAPSIASLGAMSAQTILLNSASKMIAPGLRIGWLRAEEEILNRLTIAKQAMGLRTSVPDQMVVAHYLEHGDLPATATHTYPQGGMLCWVDLGDGMNTAEMLSKALDNGVAYAPGYAFYNSEPNHSTMRLSFVTNDKDTIDEGVRRLA